MKDERELENLIKVLRPEAALPRLEFESKLKHRLLKSNSRSNRENNSHGNFFNLFKFNPQLAGLFSMAILIGLIYAISYFYSANNQLTLQDSVNTLGTTEKYAVLTSIYQNNPQSVLAANFQTGLLTDQIAANPETPVSMQPQSAPVTIPLAKNYNFYRVTYQRLFGPMAATCPALATDNTTVDTFNYETVDNTGTIVQNFSKTIVYNTDNAIRSLNLTDNTGTIVYEGGKYAARMTLPVTKPSPTSTIVPTPETEVITQIGQAFGTGIKVNKVTVNGQDVYQAISTIDSTQNNSCGTGQPATIYIVNTIDPAQDYQITETAYYLNDIKNEDLILISRNSYERDNLTPEAALQKYFTLDPAIPVRDFGTISSTGNDLEGVAKEVQAAMTTLRSGKIQVLLSNALPLKFQSYNDSNWNRNNYIQTFAYAWDPDFYSAENWAQYGQQLKDNFADNSSPVNYNLAAKDNGDAPWINIAVVDPATGSSICSNGEDTTVTVNGVQIPAKKSQSFSQLTCFTYQGHLYNLNFGAAQDTNLTKLLDFKALDPTDPVQANEIEALIKESLQGTPAPTPVPVR